VPSFACSGSTNSVSQRSGGITGADSGDGDSFTVMKIDVDRRAANDSSAVIVALGFELGEPCTE
jgi:hypothetical protein